MQAPPELKGHVISFSSFSYPTRHAHPLHALLMARGFTALYKEHFFFVTAQVYNQELKGVPYRNAFGFLSPLIRILRLRSYAYPCWLFFFLLFHPAWQEDLTIFTSDLRLAARLKSLRTLFGFWLIVDVHGTGDKTTEQALRLADRIVFVTQGLEESMTKNYPEFRKKSVVLGNAVDATHFAKGDGTHVRQSLGISNDAFVVGYSGRFKPMESDKGISFMLTSLSKLTQNVHMLLVGGTKEEVDATGAEAAMHHISHRLHLVERVSVDMLPDYLAACDVLAYVPPRADAFLSSETSPMKLFEYQAAGKPVIISNIGALRTALVGNSEVIEPGSVEAFTAAIMRIQEDRQAYLTQAKEAALQVQKNTWEARALAALERTTRPPKSMLRYAFEGVFVTATGDMVLKVLSTISTLVILHNLIPYDYGIWRLLLSALSALGLLGLTGITGMFTADIARELGEGNTARARRILDRITNFFVITGAVAMIALVIAAPIISHVSGIGLTAYLDVLSITLLAAGFRQSYQIYFQAHLRPIAAQVLKNSTTILYLIGIVFFIPVLDLGIWGIVLAYTIANALPAFLYIPAYMKYVQGGEHELYDFRRALLGRGKWALGEDYISALTSAAWPWITGYFLSISEVGIISLAMLLVSQVSSLIPIQYVLRSLLPRIVSDIARVNDWLVRGMRYALWAHIVVGLGIFLAISIALPFVAPKYTPVIPLFGSFVFILPFIALGIVLTEWFYTHKRQKEFFIANAIPSIITTICLPALLITLGLVGFWLWYAINTILTDVLSVFFIRRDTRSSLRLRTVPWPDERDWQLFWSGFKRLRARVSW